ncbi:MAG: hypothetical protein Ct9H300mP27_12150 [Chloroflexota bacterium]|nr:MAG: hypothetical protein Ct9H300mP27_12150 [Chloroflexota bacterium]
MKNKVYPDFDTAVVMYQTVLHLCHLDLEALGYPVIC